MSITPAIVAADRLADPGTMWAVARTQPLMAY